MTKKRDTLTNFFRARQEKKSKDKKRSVTLGVQRNAAQTTSKKSSGLQRAQTVETSVRTLLTPRRYPAYNTLEGNFVLTIVQPTDHRGE